MKISYIRIRIVMRFIPRWLVYGTILSAVGTFSEQVPQNLFPESTMLGGDFPVGGGGSPSTVDWTKAVKLFADDSLTEAAHTFNILEVRSSFRHLVDYSSVSRAQSVTFHAQKLHTTYYNFTRLSGIWERKFSAKTSTITTPATTPATTPSHGKTCFQTSSISG